MAAKEPRAMPRIAFTEFQADPARHLDRLAADRTMLIVTRPNHEPVAILPLSELKGLRETLHLLRSPVNGDDFCAPSRNSTRDWGRSGRFFPDPRTQAAYR